MPTNNSMTATYLLTYTTVRGEEDVSKIIHSVRHHIEILQENDVLFVSLVRHETLGGVALVNRLHEHFEGSLLFCYFPNSLLSLVFYRSRTYC